MIRLLCPHCAGYFDNDHFCRTMQRVIPFDKLSSSSEPDVVAKNRQNVFEAPDNPEPPSIDIANIGADRPPKATIEAALEASSQASELESEPGEPAANAETTVKDISELFKKD